MRRLFLFLALLCLPLLAAHAMSVEEEVRAADTARVLATVRGDTTRVASLLSAQLHYGHTDGRVQTKDQFISAIRGSQMKYEAYDYTERVITPVGNDVAVMNGRAKLRVNTGDKRLEFSVQFLAVWKKEGEAWRLLAYQSAQLPAPTSPTVVAPKTK